METLLADGKEFNDSINVFTIFDGHIFKDKIEEPLGVDKAKAYGYVNTFYEEGSLYQ